MALFSYLEIDPDSIYEEYNYNDQEEFEDEYRDCDRMDDMINKYGH